MGSRIGAFVAALAATYIVGTLSYSQLNLASLVELNMPVDASVRLHTAWHDMTSMYGLYLPLVGVALLLAFLVTGPVLRWLPQLRVLGYILGGAAAIWVMDYLLGAFLTGGTHPLVVTRTPAGLLSQCLAGAVGGYVFVTLLSRGRTE